ncbi:MAG: Mth938-like domain-containing protein [Gammaproteobacteria bacterium]|nr:Mth938-like domain-containing protein [Gammaproteobacteria bacterium]
MQFNLDTSTGLVIRSYSPGELRIGELTFSRSVIITATAELREWTPPSLESLQPDDLDQALADDPELVLLGTGNIQRFPPARTVATILRRGIGLEAMTTDAACRTYNVLAGEGRRVAAALLVRQPSGAGS